VQTMKARWSPEVEAHPETRITWEVNPWANEIVGVRVIHGGLEDDAPGEIYGGWPHILSSLKSMLETGEPLNLRIPPEAIEEWRAARETQGSAA
jgi:hypothetical protein